MPADLRQAPPSTTRTRLVRIIWIWGPALCVMAVIYAASSLEDLGPLPGDVSDKTGHFAGYALLGATVLRAVAGARWRGITVRAALVAWGICVIYGVTDEWHQRFVPGRVAALDDWVADAAGSATAILLLWFVASVRRGRTV